MKATKRNVSRAEKIRRFIRSNPNAPISYIASQFGTTYGIVYMVKRGMEAKALKKPKAVKVLGVTMAKDDVTKLTDEQVSRLAYNVTQPKARMLSADNLPITMEEPKSDPVNHPAHYKAGGIETIDFIEAKGLNYRLGNVVKYITRADHKGNRKQDLEKAMWYLKREIEQVKGA